jgi:hypothetical protein
MKLMLKTPLLMFTGAGLFAAGALALGRDSAWWITAPLLIAGIACEAGGLWILWRYNRPKTD